MPDLTWNKDVWDGDYDWADQGEYWSTIWGGTGMLWHWVLRPRLHTLLPTGTVLEIAPGCGRWSQFLAAESKRLILVDYAEKVVDVCRKRFADLPHVECHVNDGKTLPMVPAGSVDLAFSFDSLVHVDWSILDSYLAEIAVKLSPDGVAMIHHSNLAAVVPAVRDKFETEKAWHHRATDVDAEKVERRLTQLGLQAVSQEFVNWGVTPDPIDCITTFVRRQSKRARPNRIISNPEFMAEAANMRRLSALYGDLGGPQVQA